MKLRLLIVDDEEVIVSMLKTVFQSQRYEVATAQSAAEARALMASQAFDVVITDMRMESDSAGYDVVRAAAAQRSAPIIIILTAFPLLAQHWREAGAHAVLTKPTRMTELLALINRLLEGRRVGAQSSRSSTGNAE